MPKKPKQSTPSFESTLPATRETFSSADALAAAHGRFANGASPSCFNGKVDVLRYRITVELIEEKRDVIFERIQHLWDHCGNMHHALPLRNAAASIGYELQGSYGSALRKGSK